MNKEENLSTDNFVPSWHEVKMEGYVMREKMNKSIRIRLSDKDYTRLQKLADKSELTASDVIRHLIRDGKVPPPMTKEMREEVRQLMRIGNNLNQIAAVANSHGIIMDELKLKETVTELKDVITAVKERRSYELIGKGRGESDD